MRLKSLAFSTINNVLALGNVTLRRLDVDFQTRIDQPQQLRKMFVALAREYDAWLATQRIKPPVATYDTAQAIGDFFNQYLNSSHRRIGGASRFNNLMCLHLLARTYDPPVIIDSGTFTGSSAWALKLGAPDAKLYSFDITLRYLKERMPGVDYFEHDWTAFDWSGVDLSQALVYFDDHVDQARRLIEASAAGVELCVFDDDFPVATFPPRAHGGFSLPKIEFLLDESLSGVEELTWVEGKTQRRWKIPHERMDLARALIAETCRMPNTSLITDVHQTPYRLVRIKKLSKQ